ncbi:MAG: Yae1 family protein [Erysipelotrichaceae bacterium]
MKINRIDRSTAYSLLSPEAKAKHGECQAIIDICIDGFIEGYEKGYEEGYKKGLEIGRIEAIYNLVSDGTISLEKGLDFLKMSADEYYRKIEEYSDYIGDAALIC